MKLLSVKDIIFRTSKASINVAVANLVQLLGFNKPILLALVNIISSDSDVADAELDLSINEIYKRKLNAQGGREMGGKNQQNLSQFAKYVNEELSCISDSERVIDMLANVMGMPKSIVSGYLTPHLTEASLVTVNDICYLFDVARLNDYQFDRHNLKLRNQNVTLSRLKFVLSNIFVGYIPDIKEVQTIFGIKGRLGDVMEAICNRKQNTKIEVLLRLFRELFAEQGLPTRVSETLLSIFVFLKGSPESFTFEFEEDREQFKRRMQLLDVANVENNFPDIIKYQNPPRANASNYLAKVFGTYPEYFHSL